MAHTHTQHIPEKFNLAFSLAVAFNLSFVVIEVFYALHANSMSLLADAGHNLGDVGGLLLAWGANYLMTKGASDKFSYGYRKTSILAALANALLLVLTSALIAYESINHLLDPEPIKENIVIIVALIGIVINAGTAMLFFRSRQVDLNIKGAFLHLMVDALISFGVVITATIILYTGWIWADPIVGLLIVVTILFTTWGLLRDSVNLILDAVPHQVDLKAVREYLSNITGVKEVHDLHVWGLSTQEIALTVHLIIPDAKFSDTDQYKLNCDLQEKFNIHHVTIQVETGSSDNPCGRASIC